MINKDWEDFLGIQDGLIVSDFDETDDLNLKMDAVAALVSCLNTRGRVDLTWMQEHSDLTCDDLKRLLEGAIYQDPELYDRDREDNKGWVLRPQYLFGNLKSRLETAQKMNLRYGGRFDANVRLLKSALPEKVNFEVIGFSLGSPWIPEYLYGAFIKDILGFRRTPTVSFSSILGRFKINVHSSEKRYKNKRITYGTKRMTALQIIECTLNGGNVKVYDDVSRPDRKSGSARVLNKAETIAAQEKQEQLQTAFKTWMNDKTSYKRRLEQIFYDKFAFSAVNRFSGGFLDLPDLDKDHFTPYPHQRDAVARIILEKDVLLNHAVGSGKTGIIIMGLHERKRIGLSDKNLVVVPNNVLEAFEKEHRRLYPGDKILVIYPNDFRPDTRNDALAKIRDEDYVAVYMAFSSFERVGMSRQFKLKKQEERIRQCRMLAANSRKTWEKERLETIAKHLAEDLAKMREEIPYDEYITFDELGITTLAVDEVHNFKNISLKTRADGIVGMHVKGSKKCDEFLEKVSFVREMGGGVVFSTGTPLTNSIADLFVLQMFLQPEQLELLHLQHFDEWIGNFAMRKAGFEVDVDSQNYRIRTRFSHFHNLPELIGLFANVCDFYTSTDSKIDLPLSDGYSDVVVQKSPQQEEYIENLVIRTEMIRQKLVSGKEDNLLKVTHDGRAAALDIRLADPDTDRDHKKTKAYACAEKVAELWRDYPGTAQLVFCDLGTPKKGFNMYDELRRDLEELGVPSSEIAYVHDAKNAAGRDRLFNKVNAASVRVLIGSTSKLGTGVNVQKKLIAVHHLDIPWKPSDIVQREGRLIRQGNSNSNVFRFRYITAGTFDAYSWQLLENKQRFISQFMSNNLADRDARDIDDTVLTYAEIKALSVGDPLLKTRIETANELERLKIRERQRAQELRKLAIVIRDTPGEIRRLSEKQKSIEADAAHFETHRESLGRDERLSFGEEAIWALNANANRDTERLFDTVHGFRVILPAYMTDERPYLLLRGESGICYTADMRDAKAGGCIQRVEHILTHLDGRIDKLKEEIQRAESEAQYAEDEVSKGNPYTAEISRVSRELLDIDEELNRRANADEE